MRTVKEIIQDDMDYSMCKLLLDLLLEENLIDEIVWQKACSSVKNKYNPATLMMERYNG